MKQRVDDVARIVSALDVTRKSEYFRNPDRPDGSIMRARRQRQAPEVVKAKARIRVAHWRNRQDERCAPTTAQIGAALVVALATAGDIKKFTADDPGFIGHALFLLQRKGFNMNETRDTLDRLRSRLARERAESQVAGPAKC